MDQKQSARSHSLVRRGPLFLAGILVLFVGLPYFTFAYPESKGPFKNLMQVVDWEGDGDLDVIVSHVRWEAVDISWAGIGLWINQGDGTFELLRDQGNGDWPFQGFAAGAGDVDQDGDIDIFTQDFGIHLIEKRSGEPGWEADQFTSSGGINSPDADDQGHIDMGGTLTLGDLNGDGRLDAFVAGCCYGSNPGLNYAPSISWVWLNDNDERYPQAGNTIPLDFLDGRAIRQVELGDLDRDGDLDVYIAVGKPSMGTTDSLDDLVLLNDGMGNLTPFDQPSGNSESTSVALGDVNGDGQLDALVGTNTGAWLWVNQSHTRQNKEPIFVQTAQSFRARQAVKGKLQAEFSAITHALFGLHLPYGSVRTNSVFLSDLDGDGDSDAFLARLWWAEIWWNDGGGQFIRADIQFEYQEDTGVAVADFDGDGDQDIFIGRNEADYQIWRNDGMGSFESGDQ